MARYQEILYHICIDTIYRQMHAHFVFTYMKGI